MAKERETAVSSPPATGGSERGEERVTLAAAFEDAVGDGAFRLAVIAAGTANGWEFEAGALRDAVERGLFRVVASFVDHGALGAGRSARDIAGVVHDAYWDEARGAVMGLNITGSSVGWLVSTTVGGPLIIAAGFAGLGFFTAVAGFGGAILAVGSWAMIARWRARERGVALA